MDFASGETRTIAVEDGEIVYAQATELYASGTTANAINCTRSRMNDKSLFAKSRFNSDECRSQEARSESVWE